MKVHLLERLPPATQALLRARGLTGDDLTIDLPSEAGVLLVGSYAEGLAHAASDLDLLLLLDDDETFASASTAEAVYHPSSLADETLLHVHAVEVNIEAIRRSAVAALAQTTSHLPIFADDASGNGDLPMLQMLEMRLLNRLRTGVMLHGHARVEAWRAHFNVAFLPPYWAATNLIGAIDYLEDAASRVYHQIDRLTSAVLGRISAEGLILSALAYEGYVLYDLKSAPLYTNRLLTAGWLSLPPPLHQIEALLFPPPDTFGERYFRLMLDQSAQLFRYYQSDGKMPGVVRFIQRYGQQRWAIDTSFLA